MRTVWHTAFFVAAALETIACSSGSVRSQTMTCLVRTMSGDVQGVDSGASCAFLGIPFAEPPVGDLRWKPPRPARAWAPAVLEASSPSTCPQVSLSTSGQLQGSEDCLKLNIWMPSRARTTPAPVIVWIHDGEFTSASANLAASGGQAMAERTGAIVVAANYRIGPLGFLGHRALTAEDHKYPSSGNYGLLDQRAALGWIRDHIASFGGNPHDVVIAGRAAGGHSVSLHVVSPRSAGYFDRAIMQSGYASFRWRTLADAESTGNDFAAALGCTDPPQVLACLRSKTQRQLLMALPTGQSQFAETARAPWGPVVDGLEIPHQPRSLYEKGMFNQVPLTFLATRDEGWGYVDRSFPAVLSREVYEAEVEAEFGTADAAAIRALYPLANFPSPKHALAQITADAETVCEARRIARLVKRTKTQVSLYSLEREADATRFVFGNYLSTPPSHFDSEPSAACDFWESFFLGSVAGLVPASQR